MREFTIKYRNNDHTEQGVEFDNGHVSATCDHMVSPIAFTGMAELESRFRMIYGSDTGAWSIEWAN